MAEIIDLKEFLNESYQKAFVYQTLRGLELTKTIESNYTERYAIQITFDASSIPSLLLEHKVYNTFAKTRNRFTYHPEDKNIPVKAHYHVYPPNGKKELYAVNTDGTAHHQSNRGVRVPSKEADELRAMGVRIASDNIIENIEFIQTGAINLITENLAKDDYLSVFIMIG